MRVINKNHLPTAPISEFRETQGDLKFLSRDNYNKLKNNIKKRGFYLPVYTWIDENGQKWLLDGHQRRHVLLTEGWNEPIPYLVVPAENIRDAAERLLEITSQFGTITQEGIDEYVASFKLPEVDILESTNFDGIFNFDIEPTSEEPEENFEDERTEKTEDDPAIKFEIRKISEGYRMKHVVNRKAYTDGTFETVDEAEIIMNKVLEDWNSDIKELI